MHVLVWACACGNQRWMLVPSSIVFHHTILFFFFSCVCLSRECACVHVHMCVGTHTCTCIWKPQVDVRIFIPPYFEVGYLSQTQNFTNHGSVPRQLASWLPVSPSEVGITGVLPHLPDPRLRFWGSHSSLLACTVNVLSSEAPLLALPHFWPRICHWTCSSGEPSPSLLSSIFYGHIAPHNYRIVISLCHQLCGGGSAASPLLHGEFGMMFLLDF